MKVTEEMVNAAAQVVPSLTHDTVRQMLEAALQGQLFFADGQKPIDGEKPGDLSRLIHIQIADPLKALEYSQQLLEGAHTWFSEKDPEATVPITLWMTGNAEIWHTPM